MARRSPLLNVMVAAVAKAAKGLRRDFGEVEQLQVSKKGPADFVTEADRRAERVLYEELKKARPNFGFLMEEAGAAGEPASETRWLIDPLDGTTNFLHGLPHWAVTVAAERQGEILAGVVYEPLKEELFWAEKGTGAFLNDTRLRVSGRRSLTNSLIATGIPFRGKPEHQRFLAEMEAFMQEVAGIRRFGSAALDLAYVAAGRYDGFWEAHLSPWDMAAGALLVQEAGGFVTDLHGGKRIFDTGSIVAANPELHQPMLRLIETAARSARTESEAS